MSPPTTVVPLRSGPLECHHEFSAMLDECDMGLHESAPEPIDGTMAGVRSAASEEANGECYEFALSLFTGCLYSGQMDWTKFHEELERLKRSIRIESFTRGSLVLAPGVVGPVYPTLPGWATLPSFGPQFAFP